MEGSDSLSILSPDNSRVDLRSVHVHHGEVTCSEELAHQCYGGPEKDDNERDVDVR